MKLTIKEVSQAGPIYQQVKEGVEALISANELKKGDMLPKAAEVARNNNIPETEIVRAYHELVLSGTLIKAQRKNLFGEPMVEHKVG